MKKFNEEKYDEVLNYLDVKVPYKEADYFNSCLASAVAQGKAITHNKIMKLLLNGVDDEFINYNQALALNKIYVGMIDELNCMRG